MRKILVALALLALAGNEAAAQTGVRIRGTIAAVAANALDVVARDGRRLKLELTEKTTVAAARAITLADLEAGDYVGVTSVRGAEGAPVAREVHTIARTMKEGHGPWDLERGSSMTNANLDAVVAGTGNHQITLKYQGGTQSIRVPDGTPIVTTVPADRSCLVPGEYSSSPRSRTPPAS